MRPRQFFIFFLVSGFCCLVNEIVWLRLAMASFGVTTPIVSTVLSVFMGGLALGSWVGGRLPRRLRGRGPATPLRAYAIAELLIGASGIVVPPALRLGHAVLAGFGADIEWGSVTHHLASGGWIALVLVPFAAAMGATFPLAMEAIARIEGNDDPRSFSYLYVANVLGAAAGTLIAALVLIELLGFQGTLWLTASMNASLGVLAFSYAAREKATDLSPVAAAREAPRTGGRGTLGLLFLTGFASMALEVVWVRQLTPYLGTVVYAFAMILTIYLVAMFLGSLAYRTFGFDTGTVWLAAGCCALVALAATDPRMGGEGLGLASLSRVLLAVGPFSAATGILTPMLVDRWSSGAADRAGTAYAVNAIGCILGPLVASFALLPFIGERWSTVAISAPLFAAGLVMTLARPGGLKAVAVSVALAVALVTLSQDFETLYPHRMVRRDATATVIAAGTGMDKALLVNGVGMTMLSTVTKSIAHFPLAILPEPPHKILVICFGMGTSFRSALTWGGQTTAVELIPSVPKLLDYFHADAEGILASPNGRVVVDDGRRFLERTADTYDVIVIDPPPPVEAAGSSLLYSREFYAMARRRLRPGGILAQWYPGVDVDPRVDAGVVRAIYESFPSVRLFRGFEGYGLQMLASDRPIPVLDGDALAARLPARAAADLVEWEPEASPSSIFRKIVQGEWSPQAIMALSPRAPALTDDLPLNEYYLLHRGLQQRSRRASRPQPRP